MSDMWEGATWNENGELVIDVYANPPDVEPNEFDETDEDFRNGINETTATELLRTDITTAEHAVKNNISVPLKQNQYDALVSLAYNIGAKNFANSTVVKYINNPNFHSSVYPNLESAWKAWNRSQGEISNGLINRRQNEWDLYNRGIY